jgi:hypothetical protein
MKESADDELLELLDELEEELLELELLEEDSIQHSHSQLQLHLPEALAQQLQLLEEELLDDELLELLELELLELDDEELLELDSPSEASDEELLDDELSS